jgi:tetratricopeptide (TPR) repeat protein/TolA-binding protein
LAKDKKGKKEGLLKKIKGNKQPKFDPELIALQDDVQGDPSNMRARRKLADYYLKHGENVRALDQYLTVAETYAEKGFIPKSVAVYKQALQLKPDMIEVYLKLAGLYHKLGLMPEVVEQYQKAAAIYDAQGKEREALDLHRMLLDLDPKNVVGRIKLGQQYLDKGYKTEAAGEFLRVADLFDEQGKAKEKQKLLEGVLDRGLENFEILHRLVEVYREQGHTELALARLAKLHGELAGSSSTLELTAEIAEELGKPAVAIKALERASELYRKIKRADKVGEVCARILQLDAANPYAAERLSELPPVPASEEIEVEPIVAEPEDELDLVIEPPAPEPQKEIEIEEPVAVETTVDEIVLDDEEPLDAEPIVEELILDEEEPVVEEIDLDVEELDLDEEPIDTPAEEPVPVAAEVVAAGPEAVVEEIEIEEVAAELEVEEPAAEIEIEIEEPAAEPEAVEVEAEEEEDEGPEQIDLTEMSEEEAAERLDEAIDIYLKYNLREKAVEYLELALDRNPDSLLVLEKLLGIHRQAEDEAAAAELLEKLITLAQAQERPEKLEQFLTQAVENAPEDNAVSLRLAEHYEATEPERAVIHFFDLANRYRDLDQPEQAEAMLERILAIDAENEGAQQELLDLYEQAGETDKAVDKLFTLFDQARELGDVPGAEGYLRRALEHQPLNDKAQEALLALFEDAGETDKFFDLLRRLAGRYASAGELDRAIGFYQRILEADSDNLDARDSLKELYLEKGDTDEAIALLTDIAEVAAENAPAKAIDALREIISLDPTSSDARGRLRDLYLATDDRVAAVNEMMTLATEAFETDDLETALDHLDQVLTIDARHDQAKRRRIAILRDLDRDDEAIAMLFGIANEMERTGNIDKAEAALREVMSIDADSTRAGTALKDLYLNAGMEDKAIDELMGLAEAAEKAGENGKALTYWGEISGLAPANIEARKGIARLHLAAGDTDSAVAELLTVASLQESDGDKKGAVELLTQALKYDDTNEVATARLVDLYFDLNQQDQAIALLMQAADTALSGGRLPKARDLFERVVEAEPGNTAARQSLKQVLLDTGRQDKAVEQLFALADIFAQADEMARVEETFREILTLDADNTEAALALKDHYFAVGRQDAGLDILFDFVTTAREAHEIEQAKAFAEEMLTVVEDEPRALEALAEIALGETDTHTAVALYLRLAHRALDREDADQAEELFNKIVGLAPDTIEAREQLKDLLLARGETGGAVEHLAALADLASAGGDTAQAEQLFRDVLEIDADNGPALENLVDLLVAAGEGARALPEMFQLAEAANTKGDHPQAERVLKQIIDLESGNERAIELLSDVHIAAGDTGQAIGELMQLEASAEAKDDYGTALELIGRVIDLDAENLSALAKKAILEELLEDSVSAVATLLRLAGVQQTRELADDAERSIRQAQKLAPTDKTVHLALVDLLSQAEATRPVIDELLRFNAPVIEAEDHEAILEIAGRILELDPTFERAHRLRIEALKETDAETEAVAALFALSDLLSDQEKYEAAEDALGEVLDIDQTNHEAVDKLTGLYLEADRQAEAVRLLLDFGDHLQQADDYEAARNAYRNVLGIEDGDPNALRKLKESYLATADLAEAVDVLLQIVSSADSRGDAARSIDALVEILDHDETNVDAFEDLKDRYFRDSQADNAVALMLQADEKFASMWDMASRIGNLEELTENQPQHEEALQRLAKLYRETDDSDRAVVTLFRLADLTEDTGDVDRLQDLLGDIIAIDGRNLDAQARVAQVYRDKDDNDALAAKLFTITHLQRDAGDTDDAERTLREIQGIEKFAEKALGELVDLYAGSDDEGKRLAARFEQAALFAARGEIVDSEAIYNRILSEDAENEKARDSLITLYADNDRPADAAGQAIILADQARKAEQLDTAIERYGQVLEFDGNNGKARRQLKNLLIKTDQAEAAAEQLRFMADRATQAGDLNDVEDALIEILQLQAENTDVRGELIDLYEKSDQPNKAVIQLLDQADQHTAAGDDKAALADLERAAKLQPRNEAVNTKLAETYIAGGNEDQAIDKLFYLYELAMAAHRRRNAEKHLRDILDIDPDNAEAKEKVFDLFKTGVTVEEKVADLMARSSEALEQGDATGAEQALKQVLALDPTQEEARAALKEIGASAPALEPGIEEPVADDVFEVQQFDAPTEADDDEIEIDWGEPPESAVEPEPDVKIGKVFGAGEEIEFEDVDVFGEEAEATGEAPAEEPAPVEDLSAEEAALEEAASRADAGIADTFAESVPADEPSDFEAAFAAEEKAEAALEAETLLEEEPTAEAEPERWVESGFETDDQAEPEPDESVDELTRAIDEFLDTATEEQPAEESLVEAAKPEEDEGDVAMMEGIVTGTDAIFDKRSAAESSLVSDETSADRFLEENETEEAAPEVVAVEEPAAQSRVVEDFKPFTETTPDETFGEAADGDDLMSDLLHELESEAAPVEADTADGGGDLADEIFGKAEKAAGDGLDDLLGDLGRDETETDTSADVFKSFVDSLPDDMRSSDSATTHYELGIAFREMDSNEEAIVELEKALMKDDGGLAFQINYELGQCYAILGKHEMAVDYFESAQNAGSADAQTMLDLTFELAVALKKMGEFGDAKRLFEQVDGKSSNYRGAKAEIDECERGDGGGGDDNIGYL